MQHLILTIVGSLVLTGTVTQAVPTASCPAPITVANSTLNPPGPWLDDTNGQYICDPGFKMVKGEGRITCHINSVTDYHWHVHAGGPYPPECRRYYTTCPPLSNITLGYVDPAIVGDDEQVEYKCVYHYAISGSYKATCDISDYEYSYQWITDPPGATDFPPECVYSYFDCQSPGDIVGGTIVPPGPWGDAAYMQYQCDPGLVLMGADTGQCHIPADTFSYYWTYEPKSYPDWPPKCVVGYDFCLIPGDIANGNITADTLGPWAPTDKVKYECDDHHKMFGTAEATCFIPYDKQSYEWQTSPLGLPDFPPQCIYRYDDCPSPGDLVINGANVPPGPWIDDQVLDYQCDDHYIKFGADQVQCDISDDEISYVWKITPGNLGTTFTPPVCTLGTNVLSVLFPLGVGNTRGTPVYIGGSQQSCGRIPDSPQKSYLLATAYKYGAFVYMDEQGYPQGFIRDLIAEVCPLVGIHCRVVLDDNSNCWFTRPAHHPSGGQGLQGGWYDACAGYFATHERIQVFDFSMPFAKQNDVFFFIKRGSKFDPHDIRGKNIGFHPSLFTDNKCVARLTKVKGNIIPLENIKMFSTYEAIDAALISGEIDATVRTVAAMGGNYSETHSSIIPVRSMPFHCAIHGASMMTRKDSDFISLWNRGFMMLKESGRYLKLCDESLKKHVLHGQFECEN